MMRNILFIITIIFLSCSTYEEDIIVYEYDETKSCVIGIEIKIGVAEVDEDQTADLVCYINKDKRLITYDGMMGWPDELKKNFVRCSQEEANYINIFCD